MEGSGQLQSSAIIEQYAALAPQPVSALWRRENSLMPAGTRTQVLLFLVPHRSHYTIYEGWNFNSGNYLFTTDTK